MKSISRKTSYVFPYLGGLKFVDFQKENIFHSKRSFYFSVVFLICYLCIYKGPPFLILFTKVLSLFQYYVRMVDHRIFIVSSKGEPRSFIYRKLQVHPSSHSCTIPKRTRHLYKKSNY